MIGADQFYTPSTGQEGDGRGGSGRSGMDSGGGGKTQIGPESLGPTMKLFRLLPEDLAGPIGRENALRVLRL